MMSACDCTITYKKWDFTSDLKILCCINDSHLFYSCVIGQVAMES